MGLSLNIIFITNQAAVSNEELLESLGYQNKERWSHTDFYGTSKQHDAIFVGTKNKCKIISNSELAHMAFQEKNPLLSLKESEIAAIIWNETSGIFGFSLIKNGQLIRSIISIDCEEIDEGFGNPIQEELEINEAELFSAEETKEIITEEGEAYFKTLIYSEKVSRAANNLAKRYVDTELTNISDHLPMIEYH